jgi:hypothetical protein
MSKKSCVLVGLTALIFVGCGFVVRPGLSNAPSLESFHRGDGEPHDVIANGNDSCERGSTMGGGPLAYRLPPCPTRTVAASIDPASRWTPMTPLVAPMPCSLHLEQPWERASKTDDVTCCAHACPATLAACPERC